MATIRFLRETDRPPAASVDPRPLVGGWVNTNPESRGIVRLVLRDAAGGLSVRVFGAADPEPIDWGEAPVAAVFAAGPAAGEAAAFTARFDQGFLASRLQANFAQGLLIVAVFNRFLDGSGRSDYFAREFYRRQEASP